MKKILILISIMILPLFAVAQTAEECFNRGEDFYYGRNGVTENDKKAIIWYQKAADLGNTKAQCRLGDMYYTGRGVSQDFVKAVEWYQKAANQGNAIAQCSLGIMYYYGEGVSKDYVKAVEWYQKAAAQGDAPAQDNLGYMYERGLGVSKDLGKAIEWYQKAADQGDANKQNKIGLMYIYGNGVKKDDTKAFEWFQKGAKQGHPISQFNLGIMYEHGYSVMKDYTKAFELYQKSANQGYAYAQTNVGHMYENGYGVTKDYTKAIEWYQKAANQGETKAKENLSSLQKRIDKEKNALTQATDESLTKEEIKLVDTDIPVIKRVNRNTFALIFANENYKNCSSVDYAKNDGEVFREYCQKTLGLPEQNVHFMPDATLNDLIGELDWLQQICETYKGEASIIFYYAGHGIPDEASGSAYLLPTDGKSHILRTCFSIEELYNTLGSIPAKRVTVLLDACFSGAQRSGGMLASARGVAIKAKTAAPKGNMIVLTASQGDETAYKYDEAKHGLFTFFLLKKLKDSKGSVTMGELSDYILDQVGRYSIVENRKKQTPNIMISDRLLNNWKGVTFY